MFDNEQLMGRLLDNAWKLSRMPTPEIPVKDEISEPEAMEIFHELIEVMEKHKISYKVGCRIAIALSEAMLSGAVEMYTDEFS